MKAIAFCDLACCVCSENKGCVGCQDGGSIILDIQPKMKFFILFLNAWNNASRESLILIVTQKRNTIGFSLKNSCWRLGCEFLSHKMKLLLFSNLLIYSFMFNSPFI